MENPWKLTKSVDLFLEQYTWVHPQNQIHDPNNNNNIFLQLSMLLLTEYSKNSLVASRMEMIPPRRNDSDNV